jgi:hypothetical protein
MTEQARDSRRLASVLQREGTGWDIGGAVRFLLSDQTRYITGQVLVVDGAATLVGPSRASQSAGTNETSRGGAAQPGRVGCAIRVISANTPRLLPAPARSCGGLPPLRQRRRPPSAATEDATPPHAWQRSRRSPLLQPSPPPRPFSVAMPACPECRAAPHAVLRPAVSAAHRTSQRSARPLQADSSDSIYIQTTAWLNDHAVASPGMSISSPTIHSGRKGRGLTPAFNRHRLTPLGVTIGSRRSPKRNVPISDLMAIPHHATRRRLSGRSRPAKRPEEGRANRPTEEATVSHLKALREVAEPFGHAFHHGERGLARLTSKQPATDDAPVDLAESEMMPAILRRVMFSTLIVGDWIPATRSSPASIATPSTPAILRRSDSHRRIVGAGSQAASLVVRPPPAPPMSASAYRPA